MGLLDVIGFKGSTTHQYNTELVDIYPFPWLEKDFVSIDVRNIYTRILTDVLERTEGISKDQQKLLFDNCLGSENSDGLITMIAKAMTDQTDLFIVYKKELKLVRKATSDEQARIQADYKKSGESKEGVYITFKNYERTKMVKLYSALEYCTVGSLYKSMNLSKAIQIKAKDLRKSVASSDAELAIAQAKQIASGLAAGLDVLLDGDDTIETAKPDLTAAEASGNFNARKMSLYLGLPASWISGDSSKGMSDTGDGDARKTEAGLKNYYFSVIMPVVDTLFGISTSFRSEDFDDMTSALGLLKDFELTSEQFISAENKQKIVNRKFKLDPSAKGDPVKETEPPPVSTNVVP